MCRDPANPMCKSIDVFRASAGYPHYPQLSKRGTVTVRFRWNLDFLA
jgi:hypothetical protein